jgi:hypothetical protein
MATKKAKRTLVQKRDWKRACDEPSKGDLWWHTESDKAVTVAKITPTQLVLSDGARISRRRRTLAGAPNYTDTYVPMTAVSVEESAESEPNARAKIIAHLQAIASYLDAPEQDLKLVLKEVAKAHGVINAHFSARLQALFAELKLAG